MSTSSQHNVVGMTLLFKDSTARASSTETSRIMTYSRQLDENRPLVQNSTLEWSRLPTKELQIHSVNKGVYWSQLCTTEKRAGSPSVSRQSGDDSCYSFATQDDVVVHTEHYLERRTSHMDDYGNGHMITAYASDEENGSCYRIPFRELMAVENVPEVHGSYTNSSKADDKVPPRGIRGPTDELKENQVRPHSPPLYVLATNQAELWRKTETPIRSPRSCPSKIPRSKNSKRRHRKSQPAWSPVKARRW